MECEDKADLTWQGWMIFGILMVAHLLKDLINGFKMIVHATKPRLSFHNKIRSFVGGALLCSITLFVLFTSTFYNKAIATSNPEIIVNSVVILFIMEIDEFFLKILMVTNKHWVQRTAPLNEKQDQDDRIQILENQIEMLTATVVKLENLLITAPQQGNDSSGLSHSESCDSSIKAPQDDTNSLGSIRCKNIAQPEPMPSQMENNDDQANFTSDAKENDDEKSWVYFPSSNSNHFGCQ